jgi:hypothetical protein
MTKMFAEARPLKLSQPWTGPYAVVTVDVNVTLKLLQNKIFKVHANRMKSFFA